MQAIRFATGLLLVGIALVCALEFPTSIHAKPVAWGHLPLAVRMAAERFASNATISRISRLTIDGTAVFEFRLERPGLIQAVAFDNAGRCVGWAVTVPTGKAYTIHLRKAELLPGGVIESLDAMSNQPAQTISQREAATIDDLPVEAAATILEEAAGASLLDLRREFRHGQIVYVAVFERKLRLIQLTVTEDGSEWLSSNRIPSIILAKIRASIGDTSNHRVERKSLCGRDHYTVFYARNGELAQLDLDAARDGRWAEESELNCGPPPLEEEDKHSP